MELGEDNNKVSPVAGRKRWFTVAAWGLLAVWVIWGPVLTPLGNPYRYGNAIYSMAYDILQPLEETVPDHIPALLSWQRKAFLQGMLRLISHEDRLAIHALCRDLVDLQITRMDLQQKLVNRDANPLPPPPEETGGRRLPDIHALSINHQYLMWEAKVLPLQDGISDTLERLLGEVP